MSDIDTPILKVIINHLIMFCWSLINNQYIEDLFVKHVYYLKKYNGSKTSKKF